MRAALLALAIAGCHAGCAVAPIGQPAAARWRAHVFCADDVPVGAAVEVTGAGSFRIDLTNVCEDAAPVTLPSRGT